MDIPINFKGFEGRGLILKTASLFSGAKLFLFIILIFSACSLSYAQHGENTLIEEVLELSGAKKQIEQIPDIVNAQVAQRQMEVDSKVYEKISKIMTESYKAITLYQDVVNYFKNNFNQSYTLIILEWLKLPLSQKMSRLEVQASAEAMQEMRNFAAQLQYTPPKQERLALVQRLDEVVSATDLSIEMNLASFRGLAKAIDPTLPPEKRLQPGELEKLCNKMKAQLQLPLKNNTLVAFLYTYRSVSDEELNTYIDFWESDAGKWFNQISSEAIMEAMVKAAEEVGNQMVLLMKQLPKE